MLFPGEVDAIKSVIALAEIYGYGNLIAALKQAWAKKLMRGNKNLDYDHALLATNVEAHPFNFDIETLAANQNTVIVSFASLRGGAMEYAYKMGYDCALNGPNTTNCHLSLFSVRELTQEWERGKADGEAEKRRRSGPETSLKPTL